jgi:hypothetical protein
MTQQMLVLPESSPNKCRLLNYGHNYQKNIGPINDSMYGKNGSIRVLGTFLKYKH